MGNTPNTDILCSNQAGTRFVHIQVKTFVPGNRTCTVGLKAEKNFGANFFWVLADIPRPNTEQPFEYYIIPAADMARNVASASQKWLDEPGVHGQAHKDSKVRTVRLPPHKSVSGWDITGYRNNWKPIKEKLGR